MKISTRVVTDMMFVFIAFMLQNTYASNEELEKVFSRSEKAHTASMDTIMSSMSTVKAWQVLEQSSLNATALTQLTGVMHGQKQARLRSAQPKGYGGIDGARKLLNDMIFESMTKYDTEIAKCTEYYTSQCASMEACRGQIAASNYIAANSRALILDSQATISKCEVLIPEMKLELKQHNMKCKHELHKMNSRLKIILGDISIMSTILEMTDCDKKSLFQMSNMVPLHCNKDPSCPEKSLVTFKDDKLRQKISHLQSSLSHNLMHDTFSDLFHGIESISSVESQDASLADARTAPDVKKTEFNNPPLPRTKVPANYKGGPAKVWVAKCGCHMGKSPQCYKLQHRFLLVQSGIQDERDNLLEQIDAMEKSCEETKGTMEQQISDDTKTLDNAQTKLAGATEKEATAGETARQTAAEHDQLNTDLVTQMKQCSGNYINFETELCALKKIRGELYKMKGGGHSAFFQDCAVSKWDPEECTKKCKGGEQKLTRNVLTHPNGGAKCLPLAAMRSCNTQPCPVNCHLQAWSGWSKCSAECGGGVTQRLREVKMPMKYGGKPCGATSEATACKNQACEKNCKLSTWTKWTACSKDCDGGTRKRQKFVDKEPEGAGKCAGSWSTKRLQYKKCNMIRCKTNGNAPLVCNKTLDVVLVLDGSGGLGKKGWKAEVKAAETFVDAFSGAGSKANIAVIHYRGPRTWGGISKCTGQSTKKVDTEKDCGIKVVQHFTDDFKKIKQKLADLEFGKGSALTSLALMAAKSELALGRKNAKANVVVITVERPLSLRKTEVAARNLRKTARLVWVPVTATQPLKPFKQWATRRWEENVVVVKNFQDLERPTTITHVVADICAKDSQKVKFGRF